MHNFTKNTLQQRGHEKLKTNLKSKDERERVCRSCLHMCVSTSLNPSFLHQEKTSRKTQWLVYNRICGSMCQCFSFFICYLWKETSLFPKYVRDTPIIFLISVFCKKFLINIFSKHKWMCLFPPWNHPAMGFYSWHSLFSLSQKKSLTKPRTKKPFFW